MLSRFGMLAAFALALLVAAPAHAVAIFTDRAAWEAAVAASPLASSPIVNDPFANDENAALTITFDSGVSSTLSDAFGLFFADNRIEGGLYRSAVDGDNDSGSVSTLWDFQGPIFAFGLDLFDIDSNGLQFVADFDGTGLQTFAAFAQMGGRNGFLGFVGTAGFQTVTLSDQGIISNVFSADNLAFARVGSADAPEPVTLGLVGLGMLALGIARRRRA